MVFDLFGDYPDYEMAFHEALQLPPGCDNLFKFSYHCVGVYDVPPS